MNDTLRSEALLHLQNNGYDKPQLLWAQNFIALLKEHDAGPNTFDVIDAACRSPQLFSQRPETLAANVATSARLLGLTPETFTAAACKRPSLFCQRPETLASKLPYIHAIASAQHTAFTTDELLTKLPSALTYSTRHLHLRYIIAKTGHATALSSALTMPAGKAEAIVVAHFAGKTRTLQVMHAKGLISSLPEGIPPLQR